MVGSAIGQFDDRPVARPEARGIRCAHGRLDLDLTRIGNPEQLGLGLHIGAEADLHRGHAPGNRTCEDNAAAIACDVRCARGDARALRFRGGESRFGLRCFQIYPGRYLLVVEIAFAGQCLQRQRRLCTCRRAVDRDLCCARLSTTASASPARTGSPSRFSTRVTAPPALAVTIASPVGEGVMIAWATISAPSPPVLIVSVTTPESLIAASVMTSVSLGGSPAAFAFVAAPSADGGGASLVQQGRDDSMHGYRTPDEP